MRQFGVVPRVSRIENKLKHVDKVFINTRAYAATDMFCYTAQNGEPLGVCKFCFLQNQRNRGGVIWFNLFL